VTFLPAMLRRVESKGYAVFASGRDYDLNIVGIRSPNLEAGKFDDELQVWFQIDKRWRCRSYQITTDPGVPWLKDGNPSGTAVLQAKQYRSGWTFGRHRGRYECLVQNTAVSVHRDQDKDTQLDLEAPIATGWYGINFHKAGTDSDRVGKWSAGCQVFKRAADFEDFYQLCRLQYTKNGSGWDTFTYTLLQD
jgi:hypothetical protein